MSRPSSWPHGFVALAACVVVPLSLAVTTASAEPINASAPGHVYGNPQPAARTIKKLSTTFDSTTGAWGATITFGAPQSAATAGGLVVGLKLSDQKSTTAGWTARTDPAAPGAAYSHDGSLPGATGAATTATFSSDNRTVILTAIDTTLIGHTADYVTATLQDADGNVEVGNARAILGEKAPVARIPAAATRLVASRKGTTKIALSPLPKAARRTIVIYLPKSTPLAVRSLPADAYRRRTVNARILSSRLHVVGTRPRRATMVIRTEVPSGSITTVSKKVTIRRR